MHVVTGAAGFIGSAVVRKLVQRGLAVRAVLEPGANAQNLDGLAVERVAADVRDHVGRVRALKGAHALYHLAAIYKVWTPDPALLWSVNVDGTVATLLAAQKARVAKVVYTSSISVLGKRADGKPSDETTPFNLWNIANEYILSKHLSDGIALDFARSGLPLSVVLPGFPFGARDRAPTPTGNIIRSILRNEMPALVPGAFSAIDVEDCAEGHLLAAERGRVGQRYILSNHNVSFADFTRLVCREAGMSPPRVRAPRSVVLAAAALSERWAARTGTEPRATVKSVQYMQEALAFDNSLARTELGLPCTPLEDSVRAAIAWLTKDALKMPHA